MMAIGQSDSPRDLIQPRIGLSFDVFDDERTVDRSTRIPETIEASVGERQRLGEDWLALLTSDDKQAWDNGVYLTLEKAYGEASRWGMTLAYTYSEARDTGGDLFSLHYPLISDYPRHPTAGDERHRLVMSGIVGLPWDLVHPELIEPGRRLQFGATYSF